MFKESFKNLEISQNLANMDNYIFFLINPDKKNKNKSKPDNVPLIIADLSE